MSLLTELSTDPTNLGYSPLLASGDDEGIAALLNTSTLPVLGEISRSNLTTWAAATGMRAEIQDVSTAVGHPLRSSALAILDVLVGSSGGIDLAKPANMAILEAWESAGLLSAPNKASFITLATHDTPRSVALLGHLVSANEVALTVRDDSGNPLI